MTTQDILGDFDFSLLYNPDFKEDSVREEIILPILKKLGYEAKTIIRSKQFEDAFIQTGSKKRKVTYFPDYLLSVQDSYAWVLDAKSPKENIIDGDNVAQVYMYSCLPQINTGYFALCNGRQFILYQRTQGNKPVLFFDIAEIGNYWEDFVRFLAPYCFQISKSLTYESVKEAENRYGIFEYAKRPLLGELPVMKQSAKRHFGVHGYFTKQAWNVVREYIQNFSQQGDLVLDPFGGSGVTAIEALMTDRRAIHIDLNPLSVFIVNALLLPINTAQMYEAFDRVKKQYVVNEPNTDEEIKKALQIYPYPKGAILPKGSDVTTVEELFTPKQLAQLACLKHFILKEKNENIKQTLLLMFSGLLNKVNLTYHSSKGRSEGRGNSSIFAYYRYRIAHTPAFIDTMVYFESRFKKILAAKKEMEFYVNEKTIRNGKILRGTATDLKGISKETVDYIYTDPPYGKKIAYLDLSTMWNAWLDLEVTENDFEQEAIEGGEHHKTKADYSDLITESIRELYRVLKFDRWMSFVFQHHDPEFWDLIVHAAESAGFEYAGAVRQSNGQSSFKKRQNPFTVLSEQLIINFKKVRKPRSLLKANLGMDITDIIFETIEATIARYDGANLERIMGDLTIRGLELGFTYLMAKENIDIPKLLIEEFDYDESTKNYFIKKNQKFRTHIDVNLRVRYFLKSFLVRMEIEKKHPTFEDIVYEMLPLLRNGSTPSSQKILEILEDIGEHIGGNKWRLRRLGQQRLFE